MDIAKVREDVWGREVIAGVSWDLLWLVVVAAFVIIIAHIVIMLVLKAKAKASDAGKRLERHTPFDRWFHWVIAASVFVLLITGVFPIIGINFSWLTIHWIAGIVLTLAIVVHIVRALVWQDAMSMWIAPSDLSEPFDDAQKPGKYSLAQKTMHLVMSVLVLVVIATGIALFLQIDTPWWERSNAMAEATLGWMFLLHGLSTLALIGVTALHMYFAVRPEKLFYTRSMFKGWISEHELSANHDPARWKPSEES